MRYIWTTYRWRAQGWGRAIASIQDAIGLGIVVGLLCLPLRVDAQGAGDLDTRFGGTGIVLTTFSRDSDDDANAAVIQPDGKIVVVGSTNGNFALARYLPDGTPDSTFSFNGRQHTGFASGSHDEARAVALQKDGKIVVAGSSNASGKEYLALAHYHTDGQLDTTFGSDGKVLIDLAPLRFNGEATAFAIQPDGKIVVGGTGAFYLPGFALARYHTNGTLDTTFGSNGVVTTIDCDFWRGFPQQDCGDFDTFAYFGNFTLRPDGKIVAIGNLEFSGVDEFSSSVVVRYLPDGTLDATFGNSGTLIGETDGMVALAPQPDGKLVMAGALGGLALLRLHADGTRDKSFGSDGWVITDLGSDAGAKNLALQPDGKLVVIGGCEHCGNHDGAMVLARYRSNGNLDTRFGGDGTGIVLESNRDHEARVVVIQPHDGRLVVAGSATANGSSDFVVARYHAITCNGVVVTQVGTSGNDVIIGTRDRDVVFGFRGDDVINGLRGNDILCGGRGNDKLAGNGGDDILSGGPGNDRLRGSGGDDILNGGTGTDACDGGRHVNGDAASQCEKVTRVP